VNQFPTDNNEEDEIPLEEDIQIDGQHPDAFYEDELRHLPRDSDIRSLSRRVTILSVLIPCLLCGILVWAYLDLRERLTELQTAGSREVQTLSEDVLDKAASLSDEYVELEKTSAGIRQRVEKTEENIKMLNTKKVDKKALDMANKKHSEEVAKRFAALRKDVAEQKASLDAFAAHLNQRLDDMLKPLRSDLQTQKKEMAKIGQAVKNIQNKTQEQESAIMGKVDTETLKSLLENERVKVALVEKRIKSLAEEVLWLENRLNLTGKMGENLEAPPSKSGEPPMAGTTGRLPAPGAGDIIEQEIRK
jgi:DNA repair exonuclease SbcCD ATPase subunit